MNTVYEIENSKKSSEVKAENPKKGRHFLAAISLVSQLGVRIASCIIIGVFSGKYLDGLFNTSPWLLVIFSVFGILATFQVIFSFKKEMG